MEKARMLPLKTLGLSRIFICSLSLFVVALSMARAATFVGTNDPGQSALRSFSMGAGVTNLSLTVSNTGTAFSHLLLRKGIAPDDDHFDFIAHFDGRDNSINLGRPELVTTNYF